MNRVRLFIVTLVLATLAGACASPAAPAPTPTATPTPTPTPPAPGGGASLTAALAGRVLAAGGDSPLASATVAVSIGEIQRTVTTPADGTFRFIGLPAGTAQLQARATGYESKSVTVVLASSEVVLDMALTPTPAPPTPTPPPLPSFVTLARILDALGGRGVSGVRAEHAQIVSTVSDASGKLQLSSASSLEGTALRFSGASIVSRDTFLRVPGADVIVSVIPTGFDLVAFDQMARQPATKRWMSPPSLFVEHRVLQYSDLGAGTLRASVDVRTDGEVDALVADMTEALPELTGGVIGRFAGVTGRTTPVDSDVSIAISGQITVFWVEGMLAGSGYEGFARWEFRDFVLTGGVILLDSDRDRIPSAKWLRYHELGHTLGFTHVTARPSLMAPSAQAITAFDREAGRIVYGRPAGNRSPDTDPDDSSLNAVTPRRWSPWVGARPLGRRDAR